MSDYLLIESRDPFESGCSHYHELACQLAARGKQVTLFLVQNAVLVTRPCKYSEQLKQIADKGVQILADEFSLQERGISTSVLVEGVQESPLDKVIDLLADGRKVLWH